MELFATDYLPVPTGELYATNHPTDYLPVPTGELYATNQEACGYGGRRLLFQCEEMDARKAKKSKGE